MGYSGRQHAIQNVENVSLKRHKIAVHMLSQRLRTKVNSLNMLVSADSQGRRNNGSLEAFPMDNAGAALIVLLF